MMKLSANTLGMFTFIAIATTAFVWMAKRPPVESQITQFGMPLQATTTAEKATPKVVDEKLAEEKVVDEKPTEESSAADDSSSTANGTSTVNGSETKKPEEASSEEVKTEKSKN